MDWQSLFNIGGIAGALSLLWNVSRATADSFEKKVAPPVERINEAISFCCTIGDEYWQRPRRDEAAIRNERQLKRKLNQIAEELQELKRHRLVCLTEDDLSLMQKFRQSVTDGNFETNKKSAEPERWKRIDEAAVKLRFCVGHLRRRTWWRSIQ